MEVLYESTADGSYEGEEFQVKGKPAPITVCVRVGRPKPHPTFLPARGRSGIFPDDRRTHRMLASAGETGRIVQSRLSRSCHAQASSRAGFGKGSSGSSHSSSRRSMEGEADETAGCLKTVGTSTAWTLLLILVAIDSAG